MSIWKSLKSFFIKEKEEPKKKEVRKSYGYQHPPAPKQKTKPKQTTISPAERQRVAFIISNTSKGKERVPSKGWEQKKYTPKQVKQGIKKWENYQSKNKVENTASTISKQKQNSFDFDKYLLDLEKITDKKQREANKKLNDISKNISFDMSLYDSIYGDRNKVTREQSNKVTNRMLGDFNDSTSNFVPASEKEKSLLSKGGDALTTGLSRFATGLAGGTTIPLAKGIQSMKQSSKYQELLEKYPRLEQILGPGGEKSYNPMLDLPTSEIRNQFLQRDLGRDLNKEPLTKAERIAGGVGDFASEVGKFAIAGQVGQAVGLSPYLGSVAGVGALSTTTELGENKSIKEAVRKGLADSAFIGLIAPVSNLFVGAGAKILAKTPDKLKNSLILEVANQIGAAGGAGATMAVATHQIKEPGTMPTGQEILTSAAFSAFIRGLPNAIKTVKGAKQARIEFGGSFERFKMEMAENMQRAKMTPDLSERARIYKSMLWDINKIHNQINTKRFVGASTKEMNQLRENLYYGRYILDKEIKGIDKFVGTKQIGGGFSPQTQSPTRIPNESMGLQQSPTMQQGVQPSTPTVPPINQLMGKPQPFKGLQQEQKAIEPVKPEPVKPIKQEIVKPIEPIVKQEVKLDTIDKEPHQMTREEYMSQLKTKKPSLTEKGLKFKADNSHRVSVLRAIEKGKPVPQEVLRDYPDLAKKYTKPTVAEKTTVKPIEYEIVENVDDLKKVLPEKFFKPNFQEGLGGDKKLADSYFDLYGAMIERPGGIKNARELLKEQTGETPESIYKKLQNLNKTTVKPKQEIKPQQPVKQEVTLDAKQTEYGTETEFTSLEKTLRKTMGEEIKGVEGPLFKRGKPTQFKEAHQLATEGIKAVTGKDVIFYEPTTELVDRHNGIYHEGKFYINVNADNPYHVVAGHEVTHAMEEMGGKAVDEFKGAVKEYFDTDKGKYYIDSLQNAVGKDKPLTEDELISEVMADFGGEMWNDTDFWKGLHEKSPSLVKKIIDTINKILDGIKNFFKSQIDPKTTVARSMKDLQKVKDAYVKATKEFMDKTGTGKGTKFSPKREPVAPFYSKMLKVIEKKMPEKTTARTIEKMLKVHGITKDEIMWSGIDDWLQGKDRVTRKEIMDFVKENDLQVQELYTGKMSPENAKKYQELSNEANKIAMEGREIYKEHLGYKNDEKGFTESSFGDLLNPENLRFIDNVDEKLRDLYNKGVKSSSNMTPLQLSKIKKIQKRIMDIEIEKEELEMMTPDPQYQGYFFKGGRNYTELLFTIPEKKGGNFVGQHFEGEPNILAHTRFSDMETPDGKNVLFIGEIQSDWHAKGREIGYHKPITSLPDWVKIEQRPARKLSKEELQFIDKNNYYFSDDKTTIGRKVKKLIAEQRNHWVAIDSRSGEQIASDYLSENELKITVLRQMQNSASGVPDAPLKENWHEYVLKRMLRYAAENGYDKLAIATGDMQRDLYNLKKVVDRITWNKKTDGLKGDEIYVAVQTNSGTPIQKPMTPKEIKETLGKEFANKIVNSPNSYGTFEGKGLEIGGKGHNEFYDNKVVNYLNKYGKKWGAKVRKEIVGDGTKTGHNHETHTIDITDAMKESVLYEGQTKFSHKRAESPDGKAKKPDIVTKKQAKKKVDKGENKFQYLYRKFIDRQHPIARAKKAVGKVDADKDMMKLASNSMAARGTSQYILSDALVDRNGQEIGGSLKSVFDGVPKELLGTKKKPGIVSEYFLERHNISRMEQKKPIWGEDYTAEMSKKAVAEMETKYPILKDVGNKMDKLNRDFGNEWLVKSGLLSKESWETMREMYPHYVPTERIFTPLEKQKGQHIKGTKGNKFVGQSSGIKKATGSVRDIKDPIEVTMGNIDKIVKAARLNEVGQAMVHSIQTNPDAMKPFAEIIPTKIDAMKEINEVLANEGLDGLTNDILDGYENIFSKMPKGDNIVRVMVDGKPITIQINNIPLLEAATGLNMKEMGMVEKGLRTVTQPLKNLITQWNPLFGAFNFIRDTTAGYVFGSVDNPVRFAFNLITGINDITKNADTWKQYKALGGPQASFFNNEMSKLMMSDATWKQIGKYVSPAQWNNLTENLTRYNEFKFVLNRELKKGKSMEAATQAALYARGEVTVNFGRSGPVAKATDSGVIYFNAATQGLDKVARAINPMIEQDNPAWKTWLKGALVMTLPTLILNQVLKNDEDYQRLDDYTKDNFFLIPQQWVLGPYVEKGKFIRIPKARELAVLFSLFADRTMRWMQDDPEAWKNVWRTIKMQGPDSPYNNIFKPLYMPGNKDFAGRTIEPEYMKDRSPRNRYDEQTSEIAKFVGDMMNWSPKKVDYIFKSYTGMIAQFLQPLTTGNLTAKEKLMGVLERRFIADAAYSDKILTEFYDARQDLRTKRADLKFEKDEKLNEKDTNRIRIFDTVSSQIAEYFRQIRATKNKSEARTIREKVNDIARDALKEIKKDNPVSNNEFITRYDDLFYSEHTRVIISEDDKFKLMAEAEKKGVPRKAALKVWEEWQNLPKQEGYTTITPSQKAAHLEDSNLSEINKRILHDVFIFRPNKDQKKNIEVAEKKGVSRDTISNIYREWGKLKPLEGRKDVSSKQKRELLYNSDLPQSEKDAIYEAFLFRPTDAQKERIEKASTRGVSKKITRDLIRHFSDLEPTGQINPKTRKPYGVRKFQRQNAIKKMPISAQQKRVLLHIFNY